MKRILNRLKEPSTWAGFAALAVMFGVPPAAARVALDVVNVVAGSDVSTVAGIVQAVVATCAAGAVLLPEKK
jgi:hypothetical protein